MKMMELVRIKSDDNGEERQSPVWCLGVKMWDAPRTFCQGEAYGYGESGCEFETKPLGASKITCQKCRELISEIKTVKL